MAEEAAETVDNPDVLEALGDFAGEDPGIVGLADAGEFFLINVPAFVHIVRLDVGNLEVVATERERHRELGEHALLQDLARERRQGEAR